MSKIVITHKGDFSKTDKFLKKLSTYDAYIVLNEYGRRGVEALENATPVDSGSTAKKWTYEVKKTNTGYSIEFYNTSQNQGIPIVILLQYGHATRNGGWVEGRDFINPAVRPVFDKMAEEVWKEVSG